jgi:hypothetical protein
MPWFKVQNQPITEAMLPLKSLQLILEIDTV